MVQNQGGRFEKRGAQEGGDPSSCVSGFGGAGGEYSNLSKVWHDAMRWWGGLDAPPPRHTVGVGWGAT